MSQFTITNALFHIAKGKLCHTPLQKRRQGAHLPSFVHEPVGRYTTKSV